MNGSVHFSLLFRFLLNETVKLTGILSTETVYLLAAFYLLNSMFHNKYTSVIEV